MGAAMWTNGSGTNSVKPPVSFCRARVRTMWRAQCTGFSMAPNMMVMFEFSPTEWAARWASSHSSVSILSGQRVARISSSRISAAVPGRVRRPAARGRSRERGGRAAQPLEGAGERPAQPLGALGDLQGGEAVDVHVGRGGLHRVGHVDVVVAV